MFQRWVAIIAALAAAGFILLTGADGAYAAFAKLCVGYNACNSAPYTSHGYNNTTNHSSYWGADTGDNCTNYVAYVESTTYSVPSPGNRLGNAATWGTRAPARGAVVDHTPVVGSVAWWDGKAGLGAAGHVAIVESIGNGTVTVSEDAYPASGQPDYSGTEFDWKTYSTSGITGFIHFQGQTAGSGAGASRPSAITRSANSMDVFYRTTTGGLAESYWTSANGWVTQTLPGGSLAGDPIAITRSANSMDVFYRTTSGGLAESYWTSANGWVTQTLPGGSLAP